MSVSPRKKHKHRDGAETEDKVNKKKEKMTSHNVSDVVETPKKKKKNMLNSDTQHTEPSPLSPKSKTSGDIYIGEQTDQETSTKKKKKKKKEKSPPEDYDIAEDGASSSIVLNQEHTEKIKKSHKAKDIGRLHKDGSFTEEAPCSEFTDLEDSSKERKKKKKKDRKERVLDDNLVAELSTVVTQHESKKKQKDGGGLQEDVFTEDHVSHKKSKDATETSGQVHEIVEQSETDVKKKKKKKRKDEPHQEAEDIAMDEVASSSLLCQEGNEKIKRSHKAKDPKRLSGGEALYRENVDIKESLLEGSLVEESLTTDTQHISKKKTKRKVGGDDSLSVDGVTEEVDQAEDGLVEEMLISETQHSKKKKKKKLKGDESLREYVPEIPEQVDESMEQEEKLIKKKKRKRKEEPHQDDVVVDDVGGDPSYSELDTEERPGRKKSKKDSLVEELWNHDAQHTSKKKKKTKQKDGEDESDGHHGFTETTEQEVEIIDQTETHVKKKKKKKHSDRREERSEILGNENVEADEDEDAEQTSSSRLKGPQTSTDTDQDLTTQDESVEVHSEGDNRLETSDINLKMTAGRKGECKQYSFREQDLMLLKEYVPNKKVLHNLSIQILLNHELDRIRVAKKKGIMFRSGKFTIDEDEQIKKNVENFMSNVGISSAAMLFHSYAFPDEAKTINKIKKKFQFQQRIAEGLYRLSGDVVQRGAKIFHFAKNKGRFSEEEVKKLENLHEIHGDDWRNISLSLSRSIFSSKTKMSLLQKDVNHGIWSTEETNRLITAVKDFILTSLQSEMKSNEEMVTIPKRSLYKGIKWVQIQDKVETRNWTHCKIHWSNVISTRMNSGIHPFRGDVGKLTSIKMIKWLRDAKVWDYGDVIWDQLCDDIGNCTSFCAQLNLINLKQKIPGWKKMRLHEIVDHLHNVTIPKLEARLSARRKFLVEPEKKEEFLISEMFREYDDF